MNEVILSPLSPVLGGEGSGARGRPLRNPPHPRPSPPEYRGRGETGASTWPAVRRWLPAALLVSCCLGLNVYQGQRLGMDRVVPFWAAQAVPPALSNLRFHSPCDYTGIVGVRDHFGPVPWRPTAEQVNRGIENVLSCCGQSLNRTPCLVSPDDKGVIDFVKLAFVLFGYRAESFLPLYWTILGASCLVFLLRFGGRPWAASLIVVFLLGHYSVLPVVVINPQLQSVLALRFMSLLGVVATLHLVLETRSGEPLTPARWAGFFFQTALLIFVLHIRFSTVWEVLCITAAAGVVFVGTWRREGLGKRLLTAAIPAVLVVAGACGLGVYKRVAISPAYYHGGGASHVFWHSVFSGLAFSPELGPKFAIGIDDVSIIDATHRYLVERGQRQRWERIGPSEQRYDQAVRDMFFAACCQYPIEVLSAVVYHKPRALVLYIGWLMRWVDRPPGVKILWPGADQELEGMAAAMDRDDKSFRLFRPACLIALLATATWAHRSLWTHRKEIAGVLALLGLCSLMPSLLGYPTAHTINDAAVSFAMLVYVGLLLGISAMLAKVPQAHGWRPVGYCNPRVASRGLERVA